MGQPHKHAKLIKAWADGAEIESRIKYGTWSTCAPAWSTHPDIEYRIKPKTIKYRNFLYKPQYQTNKTICVCSETEHACAPRDQLFGFIKWLGDWQEVAIE